MPAALSKKMKKQARGREPVFCCIGSVLRTFKCLLQIGDDIIGVFQTDRQTDQAIREAGGLDLFFRAHGVRHGSRMLDERLAVAEADGQRAQIFSGEIAAGQPLPSYRFMSRKYQVNVATVEKAYDLLEANGYIRRCQDSGCYVLPLDNFEFFADGVVLDSFQAGQSETGPVYDFATSTPLATQEETRQFVALADELAQQRPDALLRYPPTRRRCGSIWPRAAFAAPELCRLSAGADPGGDFLH